MMHSGVWGDDPSIVPAISRPPAFKPPPYPFADAFFPLPRAAAVLAAAALVEAFTAGFTIALAAAALPASAFAARRRRAAAGGFSASASKSIHP